MSDFIQTVPLFLPGVAIWLALGALVSARLARILVTRRVVAFLLIISVGLILFATLTPTTTALSMGAGSSSGCDLSRLGVPSLAVLASDSDAALNIVLFMPLGFALGLLPWTRRNASIVTGAFLLTLLIESAQLFVPELGRGCESADMVDNTIGLALGLAFGAVVRTVVQRGAD